MEETVFDLGEGIRSEVAMRESQVDTLEAANKALREERDEARAEVERLRERVGELEAADRWSFDLDAFEGHQKAALVAVRFRRTPEVPFAWYVQLAVIDEGRVLRDPATGEDLGWDLTDVEAWRPFDITPPDEALLQAEGGEATR